MTETNQKVRDIPVWLTALILLLSVGGGGYLLYWYINSDKPASGKEIVKADPALQNRGGGGGGFNWRGPGGGGGTRGTGGTRTGNAPVADGIRPDPNRKSTWNARSGETSLYATIDKSGSLDITPAYTSQNLTSEQAQLLLMRRRLLADQPMREHVKLTDEQYEKLKKIPDFKGMVVTADQRDQLTKLFGAWQKADDKAKPAAEKELLTTLADIGKKQLDETKKFDAGRADAVKEIVTAEQLKLMQSAPAGGGANTPKPTKPVIAPTTKPTTKPATTTASN